MPKSSRLLRFGAALLAVCSGVGAARAAVARVENTATLSYETASGTKTLPSNTVSLDVAPSKRPTWFGFRLLPTGYELSGMKCETSPALKFTPAPIDAATFAKAPVLDSIDADTPFIMMIDNQGDNHDPNRREEVTINVDSGDFQSQLTLLETAPNSGIFAGGIPAGGTNPELGACDPTTKRNSRLTLSFTEDDSSFGSSITLLIDPAGFIFNSKTGDLVDGAVITLLDSNGQPASVFGDDGVSAYPSTVTSGAAVTDASGRAYPAIKGRYRFPLTHPGTYTLRVQPPGDYTAPSTRNRAEIAALMDPSGQPFILNEASYGGALTLADPDSFYADIPVDLSASTGTAVAPSLVVTKTASIRRATPGDFVQYRIGIANRGSAPARAVHVADILPTGLKYQIGSTRGGNEPIAAADGRSLDFVLPDLAAGASTEVRYVVTIAPGTPAGEALNRASASANNGAFTSNEAMASVRIQPLLFSDAMTIIGRVTEGNCGDPVSRRKGVAGVRLLLENGTFVVSDRDGLYHFEGVTSGRHVVQLDTASIPVTHEAVACDVDTRQAGSAISRFVEGDGGLLKRVDFQLRPTGKVAAKAEPLPIAVADDATAAGNRDWVAGQVPGIDWLFPTIDHNPRAPALRVVIKHLPGQRVALTINGAQTDALAFDGTDGSGQSGVAVSRWTGIPLTALDNHLVARVLDAQGNLVRTLERTVHYSGAGVRAVFDPAKSRLVADGLTRPLIAVRVTDKDGRPVRAGTLVPFRLDAPYTAAIEAELEQGRQLAGQEKTASTARVVGDDGIAFITLQPTTQAGAVHAVISLTEERTTRTSDIRAWLAASVKDWMVVGFGSGTIGYDTLNAHGRSLPAGAQGGVVTDGQLALYAKGRIKGSWLLTIAYDSKHRYDPDSGLLGTIDPNRYYTVYGDGSQQSFDTPTRRKLYLRLERREFYALFGDFETGFTDTQLGRYSRTLNGVKAAYEGRKVRAAAFAAHTDTLYSRDEIQGNGLSGPYRLSSQNIVPNTDQLRIEVRDRFRSEVTVSSTSLTRHIDYDIDTSLGTIRFRQPILSRDANQNPVFIIADYETEGGKTDKLAAGGRVAMKIARGAGEIGTTVLRDETVGAATVAAIDLKARLTPSTEIRGELASGGKGGVDQGLAYLAEVEHHGPAFDLLGYIRVQDHDFGVGQQNLVEAGTQKVGMDGRVRLTDRLTLTATGWHQAQLGGTGQRAAGEARLEYRRQTGTLFVGGQFASDTGLDGRNRDSRLLTIGATQGLLDGKLTLTGQTQFAPGGDKGSVDFPIRHQVSASYRITDGIRVIGGYEIADGADYTTQTAQVGFDVKPWTGAKLMSTINQQAIGENGGRTFAQYGLSQSLPIGKSWTVDATLDAATNLSGSIPTGASVNAFQPAASGGFLSTDQTNGNYAAVTFGGTYRAARWSWNGRVEYRTSDANERLGITSNFLRGLGEGQTLASSIKAYRVRNSSGATASFASADLALALRPLDSRWSVLERLELRHERADAGISAGNDLGVPAYNSGGDQVTSRVINNLAINYRTGAEGLGHGFEGTAYYGAKYVRGRFADDVFDGYIDVTGFELRHDITAKFDIGLQGSVQHAWSSGAVSFSGGPSVGFAPVKNLWISAGYNVAGYRDRDFEADRYTRSGPYLTARMKFDQRSIGGAVRTLFGGKS